MFGDVEFESAVVSEPEFFQWNDWVGVISDLGEKEFSGSDRDECEAEENDEEAIGWRVLLKGLNESEVGDEIVID
ncbi:hypothetical protein L1987_40618 [Smallanthus sonchifolius]|uniref:Uncharacterized protein n=1 Tax=Smallanthus sonchifolius TaxID=185202 RepID=A0ACB9GT96_9ASTR|nr:hypothetical protein L1987_40618 [Smallanthus sonchifolius]